MGPNAWNRVGWIRDEIPGIALHGCGLVHDVLLVPDFLHKAAENAAVACTGRDRPCWVVLDELGERSDPLNVKHIIIAIFVIGIVGLLLEQALMAVARRFSFD